MNKSETNYTNVLLSSQKEFLETQRQLTQVLTEMKNSIEIMNDQNVLHIGKEDERYQAIKQLASVTEARSRMINTVFMLMALAIIVLAGAEKVLDFVKFPLSP